MSASQTCLESLPRSTSWIRVCRRILSGPGPSTAMLVKIRTCHFLNNIVEQDHRRIKARVQPMLGFKKFYNARRVLIGIEFVQRIHKDQYNLATSVQSCDCLS